MSVLLARMASAQEFYATRTKVANNFLDYMEFAEDYADYVCSHEKYIDRTGLASVEALENYIAKNNGKWPDDAPKERK